MKILLGILSALFDVFVQAYREWQAGKKGEVEGREDAKQEAQEKVIERQQEAKDVKNEVQALGDDDLKRRAGRWVRPKPGDGDPGPGQ